MLATLLFLIQNSWQLSTLELPFLLRLCFFLRFHTYQLCDFLLGFLQLVYLHCSIWPPLANAALAPSPVALQLRAPPKVSARAPAHRSYHFRGVKLKSCIKKIHHNLYISKQANVRIKHADTEGASHKKFGTDARVQ